MAKDEWKLWANGNKSQKKAAKEMGLVYRKAKSQNGFNLRYFTSPNHAITNRKENTRSTKEKLDNFCKELCNNFKSGKPVDVTKQQLNSIHEQQRLLENADIEISANEALKIFIERQEQLKKMSNLTIENALNKFYKYKKEEVTSSQLTNIKRHTHLVFEPWLNRTLYTLECAEVINRMEYLWDKNRRGKWGKTTHDKYLTNVKAFLDWGINQEPPIVDENFKIKKLKYKFKSGKNNTSSSYGTNIIKYFSPEDAYNILQESKGGVVKEKKQWSLISDDELAKLIWSESTVNVAKLFGVSDKAVHQQCKRRGIPTPPVGFWAKVQHGNIPNPKGKMPNEFRKLYLARTHKPTKSHSVRNWQPVLATQFFGASRPTEAYLLPWSAFNWQTNQVEVTKRKLGGGTRHVQIKPNLKKILMPHYEAANGKGGLLPDDVGKELYPLHSKLKKQFEKRKQVSDELKEQFEKELTKVTGKAARRQINISNKLSIDWVYDGPRHSFGTYRYFDLIRESGDPKEVLRKEMGTSVQCLDTNYIGAKVLPKQVEEYFSITA